MSTRGPVQSWGDVGIELLARASDECRTHCPQCASGRTRASASLSVNLTQGLWYCHYCGWKGSLTRPGQVGNFPRPGPRQRSAEDLQRRQQALQYIWQRAHEVQPNDPVARYLQRRGIWQEPVPAVLRYHPRLPYRHVDEHYTYHPALVACVQAPAGDVVTLQRIYLTNSGTKAEVPAQKKTMPVTTTIRGAAVRLDTPIDTLALTEGIETALAVRRSAGVPVWACLSAGNMTAIVIPDTVRLVLICADHDANGTSEQAAKKLARLMLAAGRRVKILMPQVPGTDWADGMEGAQHG